MRFVDRLSRGRALWCLRAYGPTWKWGDRVFSSLSLYVCNQHEKWLKFNSVKHISKAPSNKFYWMRNSSWFVYSRNPEKAFYTPYSDLEFTSVYRHNGCVYPVNIIFATTAYSLSSRCQSRFMWHPPKRLSKYKLLRYLSPFGHNFNVIICPTQFDHAFWRGRGRCDLK